MKKIILLLLCSVFIAQYAFSQQTVTSPAPGTIVQPGGHIKIQWKHKKDVRKYKLKILKPNLLSPVNLDDWTVVHQNEFTCSPCRSCVPQTESN